jgi:hypothetical protein
MKPMSKYCNLFPGECDVTNSHPFIAKTLVYCTTLSGSIQGITPLACPRHNFPLDRNFTLPP